MLLQAYDYLHLHDEYGCCLQIGGSDQWGNITLGLELIRKLARGRVLRLTFLAPLATGRDQVRQDRVRGCVAGPRQVLALRDVPVLRAHARRRGGPPLALFHAPCERRDRGARHRDSRTAGTAQGPVGSRLGGVCTGPRPGRDRTCRGCLPGALLRGRGRASTRRCSWRCSRTRRRRAFRARASIPAGSRSSTRSCRSGLASSKSAARTAITQGGVYVNNARRADPEACLGRGDLLVDRYVVLRKGRRDYHLLQFE